jgi:hypothetical protein
MARRNEGKMNEIIRYYEIEQSKLMLDFEKVALFTQHPTSLGSFRERRLRQFLREFSPSQLTVHTGFVSVWNPHSGKISDHQSRQIDCLVFDAQTLHPLLQTDDYAIIAPSALYAAIEVKSSLTFFRQYSGTKTISSDYPLAGSNQDSYRWAGTMVEAIRNIASLAQVIENRGHATFQGIFAYNIEFDWHQLYHAFDNNEIQRQLSITHVDQLPVAICVPGALVITLSPYDIAESKPHHDASTSFFNVLHATETHPAYPLQFFTTYYTNQVNFKLTGRKADEGGLFSAIGGQVSLWRHHFDLNSEGYEDQ